jgi:hypothetical protein
MVYGCAPPGVTDELDTQIRTSTSESAGPKTTVNKLKAVASTTSAGSFVQLPTSAADRLGVPKVLRTLATFVGTVQAASYPSNVLDDCCGGICCSNGNVCVRTLRSPKCWPQAGKRDAPTALGPEPDTAAANDQAAESDSHEAIILLSEKKGGAGAAAAAAAGGHGSPHGSAAKPNGANGSAGHTSSGTRPVVPNLLSAIVLLASSIIAASLENVVVMLARAIKGDYPHNLRLGNNPTDSTGGETQGGTGKVSVVGGPVIALVTLAVFAWAFL